MVVIITGISSHIIVVLSYIIINHDRPIDDRHSYKMTEQSMDDDLESIDHLSIDERTIDARS